MAETIERNERKTRIGEVVSSEVPETKEAK